MASGRRKKGKSKAGKRVRPAKIPAVASLAEEDTHNGRQGSSFTDADALLEQARSAVDPFAAVLLYQKALEARPDDTAIMGDTAELLLQLGETEPAKEVLQRSISLAPEDGPDKYLYMAQLHEGRTALAFYEKGLTLLQRQLENDSGETKSRTADLKQRLCMGYCSIGELFLTDLCFEEDAEDRCQNALDRSMTYDYGGPEPLQALANLRLSQCRSKEAIQSAEEAFRRFRLCEPPPEQEFRVSLAKILMECSSIERDCCEKALEVLSGLMQEDDENVEIWYLMAVAFNALQPPDYESARAHLHTAAEMLVKIRTAQEEAGEVFVFKDQVQLVQDQLKVAEQAAEGDMEGEAKCSSKLHEQSNGEDSNAAEQAIEMDCG